MSDPYLGEIRMFAGNYAPQGWAFCNGQLLPISENDALYSLIGTTYGGDGVNNFALPDLRGRLPIQMGTGYQLGQAGGVETITLTQTQIPAHTHVAMGNNANGTQASPEGGFWASPAGKKQYLAGPPENAMIATAIAPAGGGQAHDNLMPYLTLSFIISLYGIYPNRP